jgi:tetratricopeptide (TPR) repeat protein
VTQYDPNKIEEYQMILLKNPRSPVFAALAEAYRKMGLLDEALEVTRKGIKHNPEFVSGLVAHAKILYELKEFTTALKVLSKAHRLKPENILALRLLGHCYMKLKMYPEALKAHKKLLIVHADDSAAQSFVKRWEFLENLPPKSQPMSFEGDDINSWVSRLPSVDQAVHLIDSFVNYGDKQVALEIVNSARLIWDDNQSLKQRQDMLYKSLKAKDNKPPKAPEAPFDELAFKKAFYQKLLQRIEKRKNVDPNLQS